MLFPDAITKPKPLASPRSGKRLRIPTGKPRLVESSARHRERASLLAWKRLIDAVSRASIARLALLKGRTGAEHVPCPWEPFTWCDIDCRCRGKRAVTVEFLRVHYGRLAIEIALFALPSSGKRLRKKPKQKSKKP